MNFLTIPLMPKEVMSMLLALVWTCPALSVSASLDFPLGGLLRCLSHNGPAVITSDNPRQEGCIVDGDLTKLLSDVETLLRLISWENPGHKTGGDTIRSQFSSQNLLAMSHNQF
jgi:hypothetical protein